MRKRKYLITMMIAVILASGYMVASAPIKKKSARSGRGVAARVQSTRIDPSLLMPSPEAVARLSPSSPYKIEPMPVRGEIQPRTAQQDEVLQEAATVMSRLLPVPPERVEFFNWINGEDVPFTIWGWHAFVHDASPIPGGWAISLTVRAKVTGGYRVGTAYIEEYTWINGTLSFVKGFPHPKTPERDVYML